MVNTSHCPADFKSVCKELQAYRDTGLNPEEITNYICMYDNEEILKPCAKVRAAHVDEAKDKFVLYLKNKENIKNVNLNQLYIVNYKYLSVI